MVGIVTVSAEWARPSLSYHFFDCGFSSIFQRLFNSSTSLFISSLLLTLKRLMSLSRIFDASSNDRLSGIVFIPNLCIASLCLLVAKFFTKNMGQRVSILLLKSLKVKEEGSGSSRNLRSLFSDPRREVERDFERRMG